MVEEKFREIASEQGLGIEEGFQKVKMMGESCRLNSMNKSKGMGTKA